MIKRNTIDSVPELALQTHYLTLERGGDSNLEEPTATSPRSMHTATCIMSLFKAGVRICPVVTRGEDNIT
jgi:hypothetical protein